MQKQYQYDANGNIIKEIKNDGTEIDYQYNNLNQRVKAIYEKNGTTPINYTDYTYDDNGNRTAMIDEKVQDGTTNISF